jgi:hypothetical protein
MKRWRSAGRDRARKHGIEPVVIGFVERMVRGRMVDSIGESGFWAIIERKIQLDFRVL